MVALLDAIVGSERPVVVEVGEDDYMSTRTYSSIRGLLRRTDLPQRSPREETFEVAPYTRRSAIGRGVFYEPRGPSEGRFERLITLAGGRFVSGRLITNDGDDYFYLTLWMSGIVVRLMDTNAH